MPPENHAAATGTARSTGAQAQEPTLLEQYLPRPDFTMLEQAVVPAPAQPTYAAIGQLDLTRLDAPALKALFWMRGLPERLRRRTPPRQRTRFTLSDLVIGTDWVLLGERQNGEVALGAAGRFWTPVIHWIPIERHEFAEFSAPGQGKLAMSFSVHPYGSTQSIVVLETRVVLGDRASRRAFGWYWSTTRPLIRVVVRGMLRAVRQIATES